MADSLGQQLTFSTIEWLKVTWFSFTGIHILIPKYLSVRATGQAQQCTIFCPLCQHQQHKFSKWDRSGQHSWLKKFFYSHEYCACGPILRPENVSGRRQVSTRGRSKLMKWSKKESHTRTCICGGRSTQSPQWSSCSICDAWTVWPTNNEVEVPKFIKNSEDKRYGRDLKHNETFTEPIYIPFFTALMMS